jgi:TctA family transporter
MKLSGEHYAVEGLTLLVWIVLPLFLFIRYHKHQTRHVVRWILLILLFGWIGYIALLVTLPNRSTSNEKELM